MRIPVLELRDVFGDKKPIIGVVHLPPLPGSPLYNGDMEAVIERAVTDALRLEEGGIDGIIVENFMDFPFLKVPGAETIAAMAVVTREVVKEVSVPVGVNVLRNGSVAGVAICAATGAKFIRSNVYVETVATDSGVIEPAAPAVLRAVRALGLDIAILADIRVKHGSPIGDRTYLELALDAKERGLASAVIVTGRRTGEPPDPRSIAEAKRAGIPVLIGSGLTPENARLFRLADGAIIGSYFKKRGVVTEAVDAERVRKLVSILRSL